MSKIIKSCDNCANICVLCGINPTRVCGDWKEPELSKCRRKLEIATRTLKSIHWKGLNKVESYTLMMDIFSSADKALKEMEEV